MIMLRQPSGKIIKIPLSLYLYLYKAVFFFLFENDTTEKQKKFSFSDFSFLFYKFIRKNATVMHYEAKLFREMLTDI